MRFMIGKVCNLTLTNKKVCGIMNLKKLNNLGVKNEN